MGANLSRSVCGKDPHKYSKLTPEAVGEELVSIQKAVYLGSVSVDSLPLGELVCGYDAALL